MIVSTLVALTLQAQTQKFDIAFFVPPQGWQRIDTNGSVAFFDTKKDNGTSFCQIILYPSSSSQAVANKNFQSAWQNLVTIPTGSKVKPVVQTEKTPDGWTVVTGAATIHWQGMTYNTMVASITGFGKTMPVQVNTAGGDYTPVLEKFFNDMKLDNKTTSASPIANTKTSLTNNSPLSMEEYFFTLPEGWTSENKGDHILMQNPQSGCIIRILSPQPSSGNLEEDARAVFDMMYAGWNYEKSGAQQFVLSKGYFQKGLPFFRKEAAMSATTTDGRYHLEEGSATIVKAADRIIIISAKHNSSHTDHYACYRNYNTCGRFFNSFTVKGVSASAPDEEELAKHIIGFWKLVANGVVDGDYLFAANGNYQSGGGIGSSTTTKDSRYEYIYNRAYSFEGDGSYSIANKELQLKRRGATQEKIPIRFEQVNYGGTGWKERLYLQKKDSAGEYEVTYEKQNK